MTEGNRTEMGVVLFAPLKRIMIVRQALVCMNLVRIQCLSQLWRSVSIEQDRLVVE